MIKKFKNHFVTQWRSDMFYKKEWILNVQFFIHHFPNDSIVILITSVNIWTGKFIIETALLSMLNKIFGTIYGSIVESNFLPPTTL